jgi:hypothetical protein
MATRSDSDGLVDVKLVVRDSEDAAGAAMPGPSRAYFMKRQILPGCRLHYVCSEFMTVYTRLGKIQHLSVRCIRV